MAANVVRTALGGRSWKVDWMPAGLFSGRPEVEIEGAHLEELPDER